MEAPKPKPLFPGLDSKPLSPGEVSKALAETREKEQKVFSEGLKGVSGAIDNARVEKYQQLWRKYSDKRALLIAHNNLDSKPLQIPAAIGGLDDEVRLFSGLVEENRSSPERQEKERVRAVLSDIHPILEELQKLAETLRSTGVQGF